MEEFGEAFLSSLPSQDLENQTSFLPNVLEAEMDCELAKGCATALTSNSVKSRRSVKGLTKADRKNTRKSSKMMQVVSRQVGVKISEEPSEVKMSYISTSKIKIRKLMA